MQLTSLIARGVDVAPIGISITDAQTGRYLYANDAMSELLGRSAAELHSLTLREVTHADDHARDDAARQAMLDGSLDSYYAEKRYTRPDQTSVWVAVHVVPIRADDGEIQAFFAHKLDITERKRHEQRLASYVSDAEWLGRIRDALDQERLVLYGQPIVDLHSGEVVQHELLLRMHGEQGGSWVHPRSCRSPSDTA
jgi:PAS domain S-box-containing protein